jgi:nucleotide-binding universal stress UspA family protein
MIKIIVAIDSLNPSKAAVYYACDFAKKLDAGLVAVFLDDISNWSYESYQMLHNQFTIPREKHNICKEQDDQKRKESVSYFEEMARENNLNYTIHHDRNMPFNELNEESKYADLLIIESNETMAYYSENTPTHFIKNLLQEVHCPVLIVPGEYKTINKVVFLYDGGPYSTTAIKMFSYLFPVYCEVGVEVLTVKSKKQDKHVLNNHLLKEYMKKHFPNTIYTVLNGLPDVEIINYLKYKQENEFIVLGAYNRGILSRIIRPSIIEALMKEIRSPLFIDNN